MPEFVCVKCGVVVGPKELCDCLPMGCYRTLKPIEEAPMPRTTFHFSECEHEAQLEEVMLDIEVLKVKKPVTVDGIPLWYVCFAPKDLPAGESSTTFILSREEPNECDAMEALGFDGDGMRDGDSMYIWQVEIGATGSHHFTEQEEREYQADIKGDEMRERAAGII